jgi:hypothetical protein
MGEFMTPCRGGRITILGAVLGVVAAAAPALAGGGNVLPPTARPKGYSLADMAAATAAFNAGSRAPETLPDVPFQILYISPGESTNTLIVKPGTMLYVPVAYSDDSPPVLGDIPDDVTDQEAVADYYFSQEQFGAVVLDIVVDGKVTPVGPDYAVGVETPPLPDGGGTRYTTVAAFLTPLTKGTHTVTIRGLFTGDALDEFPDFFPDGTLEFDISFTVIVR